MHRHLLAISVLLVSPLSATTATAETIRVPADQPTIRQALVRAGDGDRVLVSAGTYHESPTIGHKTDLVLEGRGKVILADSTGRGLRIDSCVGVTVRNLRITDSREEGIQIENSRSIRIEDCTIRRTGREGILAIQASGILLRNNRIEDAARSGIHLGSRRSVARQNRIIRADVGITLDGATCIVEDNRITDPVRHGIASLGAEASGCLITGNRIEAGPDTGSQDALDLVGARNAIHKNRVRGFAGRGIDALGLGALVLNNRIERCDDHGIVTGQPGPVVAGNDIRRTGRHGILPNRRNEPGQALVAGNRIRGVGEVGLRVVSHENAFIGNRVSGSGGQDLSDQGEANTYIENDFRDRH